MISIQILFPSVREEENITWDSDESNASLSLIGDFDL